MSAKITAPSSEIASQEAALALVASALPELRRTVGATLVSLVKQGFMSGSSPSGAKWAPVARGGQPLRKTGALANSTHADATATGVRVTVGAGLRYALVHQRGAIIRPKSAKALAFRVGKQLVFAKKVVIPARPFLPEGALPPKWNVEVEKTVQRVLAKRIPSAAGGAK